MSEVSPSKERSIPGAGAEQLAELFHATYERLAPKFGYTTRTDTRRFDRGSHNGKLMIAVCEEILRWFDREDDEIRHLRTALQIIADGTLCPDLFPALDVEKDVWEMQAKTAMTSAIAALERLAAAPGAAMAEETKPLREMSNAELATLSNEELGARLRAAYDSAMEPLIPIREQSALELLETHAKALEAENARLRAGLGMDQPWPLPDVLAKLIQATEHLLKDHGCDVHGHEEYRAAADYGQALLLVLRGAVETSQLHKCAHPVLIDSQEQPGVDIYVCARCDAVVDLIKYRVRSPEETAAKPPLDTDDIERLAREHFCEVHGIPPVDQWPMMPEEVKESYRQWIRNKQSELAAEKATGEQA